MRPRVIVTDFIFSVRAFLRSKGTLFWTLAFPIMLILIFGAIFFIYVLKKVMPKILTQDERRKRTKKTKKKK